VELEVQNRMKVSDYIARFLEERRVPFVFEMSGGMITHMLDSLHLRGKVRIVSVHHEQTAAFAADAVGRMTGIPGVAMATSGPGATNLLTGIGSCYFDSAPAVFITGQVNRHEQKGDRAVRQLGFQETDIVSMAKPITKAAWLVNEPDEIPAMLHRAFDLAVEGRPGPVLLDIPMDVQRAEIVPPSADAPETVAEAKDACPPPAPTAVREWFGILRAAERPLILVGGGIRSGWATEGLRAFARAAGIPVVHSLMAVDVMPAGDPLHVGMIGSYGNRWANLAVGRSDCILVLGSRLDVRQTGADTRSWKGDRTILHVDVEVGEMNNRVADCSAIRAELRPFLEEAAALAAGEPWPDRAEWVGEIRALREAWPDTAEINDVPGINPNRLMHQLAELSRDAAAYVVDVGQHQMWAAQSLDVGPDQRFLTSGGMGSMGFALPAAVGAAFAAAPRPVVLVAGDGGFQTNIQELQTVVRNRLPVKMVVINNGCHGMVRQFQESYFEGRYQSTLWGYDAPDFAGVAAAYGINALTVADEDDVPEALARLWRDPAAPALLQVMVDTHANAYPKIAFGRPMTEMEPYATPVEMEST
jgi:acetolactate synthase-1/2/3 large subunit